MPALEVPDDALIFRGGKVYVPLVRDNRLVLSEVGLGYDDGRMVEVTSGVTAGDLVAINVGQAARDGELVRPSTATRPDRESAQAKEESLAQRRKGAKDN